MWPHLSALQTINKIIIALKAQNTKYFRPLWSFPLTNVKWHSVTWQYTMTTPTDQTLYRTRPFTEFWVVSIEHLRWVWHADRGRLLLRHLVPSFWDLHIFYLLKPILFRTCRYFTGLCSSNIPRYSLDIAWSNVKSQSLKEHTILNSANQPLNRDSSNCMSSFSCFVIFKIIHGHVPGRLRPVVDSISSCPAVHWHPGSPSSSPFVRPSPSESREQISSDHTWNG